ncbi:MAG: methionine gamma-lyase family protein [Clostridia bacterium]|nr:methionine gamma-lyase family protein [Clostridia bacterium]
MENIENIIKDSNEELKNIFDKLDIIEFENTKKVLEAFKENKISEAHLNGTTGYGYGDVGREAIESIFAKIFKGEDALVRSQFISGTHTISTCLFGILRPGDTVLSINGKPYDTLDEVLGIEDNPSSLKSWGVNYEQVELKNGKFDISSIIDRVSKNDIKLIICQRSRGYLYRDAFTIDEFEELFKEIRKVNNTSYIMVDNCYGEFTDTKEPLEVGADVIVGSLIKNPGAGIAKTGGYIVGKKELIDLISDRYSAPGLGKEGGASFNHNREILQGIFMAPHTVNQSLKTAVFSAYCLERLGYEVSPKFDDKRSDIVQMIKFQDPDKLVKYCQGIQAMSPVDSFVKPMPWDMPGYTDQVVMASGSFVSGSSIEISCDGPLREPFVAYQQGGLTYQSGKLAVINAIKNMQ